MKAIYGVATALATILTANAARAQANYPDHAVRMLVGFAAAGPADMIARVVGDKLNEAWGQAVVIENVAGAAANIAGDRVAKSPTDGYTLLMASNGQVTINPSLYERMSYDPLKDLAPISQAVSTPNLLVVNNSVPAKTVAELTAYLRANPGKISYGSAGAGTTQHLAGELYKSMAKVNIQHVPYRGAAPVITDLLGGRIQMFFGNIAPLLPLVRDGKLRALAVTSLKRFGATPEIPTMAESGFPGFDSTATFGLMAPAATPAAIVDKIYRDQARLLARPEMRARLAEVGMEVVANTPAEFAAVLKAEVPVWAKVIKETGLKATD